MKNWRCKKCKLFFKSFDQEIFNDNLLMKIRLEEEIKALQHELELTNQLIKIYEKN